MGPTERALRSTLDLMRDGGYSPRSGSPVPIEEIHAANLISEDQYRQILREMEEERRNFARRRTASEMGAESDALAGRMRRAMVPTRYQTCAIDVMHVDRLLAGDWLYFTGRDVDAVTMRACAAMKGWLSRKQFGTALFERTTSLLSAFRDGEVDAMSRYAGVGLLLMSGMGSEPATDWALSKMGEVVNRRFGDGMPLIVTTRHDPSELAQHLSGRGNVGVADDILQQIRARATFVRV